MVIDCYALILNSLASCACDAIEPPVPPAAHKVACIPDKIVVRVSGRYGVATIGQSMKNEEVEVLSTVEEEEEGEAGLNFDSDEE